MLLGVRIRSDSCQFSIESRRIAEIAFRVITDDKASLVEKYSVDTVPTVLMFENGKVTKRLDGEPGAGLDETQLRKLLAEN